ncbi:hypothetical protein FG379_002467 [Cryptosporidium bovis]|uniref:uncharacterized protein n=1 Tax=Cryptosporidium bovis TaxID=310047 RepID=UPI00351A0648|nr:hypothetical protein FG379_002467 [Cryptosporidium bovis]
MKCFYVLSLNNKEVISDTGISLFKRISDKEWNNEQNENDISLKDVYDSKLDNEEFRQCVINCIIRQMSMLNPIRYEGLCPIFDLDNYLSLWRVSKKLNAIFVMVIDGSKTFPLRGKYVLDFVVDWSEKSLSTRKGGSKFKEESKKQNLNGKPNTDDILVLLNLVAPSGQLQLLNDEFLNNIELLMSKSRKIRK